MSRAPLKLELKAHAKIARALVAAGEALAKLESEFAAASPGASVRLDIIGASPEVIAALAVELGVKRTVSVYLRTDGSADALDVAERTDYTHRPLVTVHAQSHGRPATPDEIEAANRTADAPPERDYVRSASL